ncbi:ABC transporter substrate-binding protein [Pseudomonas sp. PSKL.D1]|uniref:ABC transporter substrate-binding protein n=1 Tax=Pseudomonas sp. PSKL.D1 TaxID=3029060 RepID=UPI00238166FB|nr:ABC transporter substrate-binding protein [Pseudomonas sp. PSKL.D1]WDY55672.1 ABC transporter substrate-binding protein [Pseudomonas sp. PSKL.D1]
MNRNLSFFLAVLTLTLTLPAWAEPAQRMRIGVGGQASIYHLPLAVALHKGYFKEQQLDVEVVDFAGGGKAMQALLADAVDVISGAYEHTVRANARGMATQAFVLASETPQIAMAVSARHFPEYRSLADLRGKTIGISAPGSSTQMVASRVLNQAGVSPDDVSFIGLGTGMAAIEALVSGKVHALVHSEPLISQLQQRPEVTIVADTRTPADSAQLFGGPVPANVLLARMHYIEAHPQRIQRLTNAMLKALRWLNQASPEDIAALVPQSWQLNDALVYQQALRNVLPALSADGRFSEEGIDNLLKALESFDPTLTNLAEDNASTWTNRFVDNAP